MKNQHIIIVGSGFAGLNCAKYLAKNRDVHITLIDRKNHHLFQPLLYQVATAGLSPADIAVPIRSIFSNQTHIKVVLENVVKIDRQNKIVQTEYNTYIYDFLVIASGSNHSYFQHSDWEQFAPGLKTLEQATEIRRRVLKTFEIAELEQNIKIQKKHLTFVIVGGGATGVEMAGAIAEIAKKTLQKDFRNIDPT